MSANQLLARWQMVRQEMIPLEEKLAAAKAGAKQVSADYMEENWPKALADQLAELTVILEPIDAELRAAVVAGEHVPGAHTSTKKTAIVNEAEAIRWAEMNHRSSWFTTTLTKEARKEIEKAMSDRLHPLFGVLPESVAKYTEEVSSVFTELKMLNPKDVKDM